MCRAGVSTFAGTEKFGLQQVFGNGAAIDRDKRAAGAVAALVHGARDQFLAGAGLALYQHRCHAAGNFGYPGLDGLHHGRTADQALQRCGARTRFCTRRLCGRVGVAIGCLVFCNRSFGPGN
ncbi:hypothetical protein D9M73_27020 [compost metagenome]